MAGNRLARLGAMIGLVFAGGCGCEDDLVSIEDGAPVDPCEGEDCPCPDDNPSCHVVSTCATDTDCPEHECCLPTDGDANNLTCQFCPRTCTADTECCPGQTCNENLGRCFDRFDECTTDEDCGRPDRVCTSYTDPHSQETTQRCDYQPCESAADCGEGFTCFSERCIQAPPCDGGCDAGEVCVLANDRCQEDPLCTAEACAGGFVMVYDDPDNVYDGAQCRERPCHCEELPPLTSTDQGRYAANGFAGGKVVVSAYDGTFGDLVLHTFDPTTGRRESTEWVDGVPATGEVVGGPSGARNGIADPGPDVGRHTDLVTGPDGAIHVSYYDGDAGDLKYARRDPAGAWTVITVDGADADVGRFTSIALDAAGAPAIAYYQQGGGEAAPWTTGLKLARAATAAPAAAADFTLSGLLDQAEGPVPPCSASCDASSACVDDGGTGTCVATVAGCDADPGTPELENCGSGDACVDLGDGAGPSCRGTLADESLAGDLPKGVGLFPSLVFRDGEPVIFYFSSLEDSLRAVESAAGTFGPPVVVDGGPDAGGADARSSGWYPSAAVAPDGSLFVVFGDLTAHSVIALGWVDASIAASAPNLRETVDPGVGSGEVMLVGADASLAITPIGDLIVAYQDQTRGDLLVARRSRANGAWGLPDRHGDGALGFWADVVVDGGRAYVTHTRVKAGIPDLTSMVELVAPIDAP